MLEKIYNYWKGLKRAKRLDSWYRRKIKKRTVAEFVSRWSAYENLNYDMLKEFSDIMDLPNCFIFPNDRLSILFCSPYDDLREVLAIMMLEKYGIMDMNVDTLYTKYKYAKNILITPTPPSQETDGETKQKH